MKPRAFWRFQNNKLAELGYPIRWRKVLTGAIYEIVEEIQNPKVAFGKLRVALKARHEDEAASKSVEVSCELGRH